MMATEVTITFEQILTEWAAHRLATQSHLTHDDRLRQRRLAFEEACAKNPDLAPSLLRHPVPSHFVSHGVTLKVEIPARTEAGYGQAAEILVKRLATQILKPSDRFHVDCYYEEEDDGLGYDNRSDGETYFFVDIQVGYLDMTHVLAEN